MANKISTEDTLFMAISGENKLSFSPVNSEIKVGMVRPGNSRAVHDVTYTPDCIDIVDILCDKDLLAIANERLQNYDPSTLLSEEEMNARLGLSSEDILDFEEIEFE